MADFSGPYEAMIIAEGGYRLTDIKGDRGGQTYAGIARTRNPHWPGWAYIDRGETPPAALVRDFYRAEFWDRIRGDDIGSTEIAGMVFDFAVNAGVSVAVKLAQIVAGVTPDGKAGPKTAAALNNIDPQYFKTAYTLAKITRYVEIVGRDRSQGGFLLGWIRRALHGLKG
jgi:lysozyme family protein